MKSRYLAGAARVSLAGMVLLATITVGNVAKANTEQDADNALIAASNAAAAMAAKRTEAASAMTAAQQAIVDALAARPGCSDPVELLLGDGAVLLAYELMSGNGVGGFCDYAEHAWEQGESVMTSAGTKFTNAANQHDLLAARAHDWDFTNDPTAAEWTAVVNAYNAAITETNLATAWFNNAKNYANASKSAADDAKQHYLDGFIPGGPGPGTPPPLVP